MKRFVSLFLALIMIVTSLAVITSCGNNRVETNDSSDTVTNSGSETTGHAATTAEATLATTSDIVKTATPTDASYFFYEVMEDGNIKITGLQLNFPVDLVIPNEIDGKKVTVIGKSAFDKQITMHSCVIMDGIEVIEDFAFFNCYGLLYLYLPESLVSVGEAAFSHCFSSSDYVDGVKKRVYPTVVLPSSLTVLPSRMFENCKYLGYVYIQDGTTEIGDYMFLDCSALKELYIPKSVNSIYETAFEGCKKIKFYVYRNTFSDKWFSAIDDYASIINYID